jgi:hypothetical protein
MPSGRISGVNSEGGAVLSWRETPLGRGEGHLFALTARHCDFLGSDFWYKTAQLLDSAGAICGNGTQAVAPSPTLARRLDAGVDPPMLRSLARGSVGPL